MINRAQLDELRTKWIGSHDEMSAEEFKELLDTIEALLNVAEAAERLISRTDSKAMLPGEFDDVVDVLSALKQPGKETPR